ncbi:hypothetical protein BJ980_001511 [Nocardioides daedukensis]|uniref:PH domain-containing protein n=1 Tax=Nocardioides daedukensis TaxID=634462 RepID=A0A7Y9UNI2_9ACTN|nr:hypothetical protein [Nocardioides daedukensis]NYG58588.1 hypothetical protein [Nocardioides daedukensis]
MIHERVRKRAEELMAGYVADGVVRIGANRWVSITSTVVGLAFLALAVASVITTPDEEWDARVVSGLALAVLLSAAIAAFGIRLLFQHERLVVDRDGLLARGRRTPFSAVERVRLERTGGRDSYEFVVLDLVDGGALGLPPDLDVPGSVLARFLEDVIGRPEASGRTRKAEQ